MRFFGSAMYFPHVDGGFTRFKLVDTAQCFPFSDNADPRVMAFAEPLAVAIHAAHQAGEIRDKKVFISGVGPIGCLLVSAVKALGASEVVCADVSEHSLSLASKMGADTLVNISTDDLTSWKQDKGYFDIAFEVSGQAASVSTCLDVVRARSTLVLVGMIGTMPDFPLLTLIAKEISLKGSFRFNSEFATATQWLDTGVINPLPLLSAEYPYTEVEEALKFASDKTIAAKVQITFG